MMAQLGAGRSAFLCHGHSSLLLSCLLPLRDRFAWRGVSVCRGCTIAEVHVAAVAVCRVNEEAGRRPLLVWFCLC